MDSRHPGLLGGADQALPPKLPWIKTACASARALTFLPWRLPPLLIRHRESAGEILNLAYDARGRLLVEARVDHVEARR